MYKNFYHKSWKFGHVLNKDPDKDQRIDHINRFTLAFNVMRKIGIGFEIIFSTHAVDFRFTILCFNINGYLFYRSHI